MSDLESLSFIERSSMVNSNNSLLYCGTNGPHLLATCSAFYSLTMYDLGTFLKGLNFLLLTI